MMHRHVLALVIPSYLLAFSIVMHTEPSVIYLKGMTSSSSKPGIVNQEFENVSPTMGAIMWYSTLLRNIYDYAPDTMPLAQLVHALFYRDHGGIFGTTHKPGRFATYCTPELIGNLVGIIMRYQRGELERSTLQKLLHECMLAGTISHIGQEIVKQQDAIRQELAKFAQQKIGPLAAASSTDSSMETFPSGASSVEQKVDLSAPTGRQSLRAQKAKAKSIATEKGISKDMAFVGKEITRLQQDIAALEQKLTDRPALDPLDADRQALTKLRQEQEQYMQRFTLLAARLQQHRQAVTEHTEEAGTGTTTDLDISRSMQHIKDLREQLADSKQQQESCRREVDALSICITTILGQEAEYDDFIRRPSGQAGRETLANLVPSGLTVDILLALLWRNATSIEVMHHYLAAVAQTAGIPQDALFSWRPLVEPYTQDDYRRLHEQLEGDKAVELSFDDLVFLSQGFELYDSPFPPHVDFKHENDGVQYQGHAFADCGETSLRNLLNLICYDSATREFSLQPLRELARDADPSNDAYAHKVLKFYEEHSSTDSIDAVAAHNAWADVVSGIPGVLYTVADVCDISPGFNNMLVLIGKLFPGIKSLQDITDRLRLLNIDIRFIRNKDSDLPTVGIEFHKSHANMQTVWQFTERHFELPFNRPEKKSLHLGRLHDDLHRQGLANFNKVLLESLLSWDSFCTSSKPLLAAVAPSICFCLFPANKIENDGFKLLAGYYDDVPSAKDIFVCALGKARDPLRIMDMFVGVGGLNKARALEVLQRLQKDSHGLAITVGTELKYFADSTSDEVILAKLRMVHDVGDITYLLSHLMAYTMGMSKKLAETIFTWSIQLEQVREAIKRLPDLRPIMAYVPKVNQSLAKEFLRTLATDDRGITLAITATLRYLPDAISAKDLSAQLSMIHDMYAIRHIIRAGVEFGWDRRKDVTETIFVWIMQHERALTEIKQLGHPEYILQHLRIIEPTLAKEFLQALATDNQGANLALKTVISDMPNFAADKQWLSWLVSRMKIADFFATVFRLSYPLTHYLGYFDSLEDTHQQERDKLLRELAASILSLKITPELLKLSIDVLEYRHFVSKHDLIIQMLLDWLEEQKNIDALQGFSTADKQKLELLLREALGRMQGLCKDTRITDLMEKLIGAVCISC